MKKLLVMLSLVLVGGGALVTLPVLPSQALSRQASTSCAVQWGSGPKAAGGMSTGELFDVRAGRNQCFDRLVLDVAGPRSGYFVNYVDQVRQDGSGDVVPVRGGARLEVVARVPTISTDALFLPNGELANVSGFSTFRHVAWAGTFEGQTTIGLGVRARLPFRVIVLSGPGSGSRIVVDVAHRW